MIFNRKLRAQIAELELLLQLAYEHTLPDGGHRYFGTGCRHDNHEACKVVCKTCSSPCVCACHIPGYMGT